MSLFETSFFICDIVHRFSNPLAPELLRKDNVVDTRNTAVDVVLVVVVGFHSEKTVTLPVSRALTRA